MLIDTFEHKDSYMDVIPSAIHYDQYKIGKFAYVLKMGSGPPDVIATQRKDGLGTPNRKLIGLVVRKPLNGIALHVQWGDALVRINKETDQDLYDTTCKYPFLAPVFISDEGCFTTEIKKDNTSSPRPMDPIIQVGHVVLGDCVGGAPILNDIGIYFHLRDVPYERLLNHMYEAVHAIESFKVKNDK